jgi:hypothetical protein
VKTVKVLCDECVKKRDRKPSVFLTLWLDEDMATVHMTMADWIWVTYPPDENGPRPTRFVRTTRSAHMAFADLVKCKFVGYCYRGLHEDRHIAGMVIAEALRRTRSDGRPTSLPTAGPASDIDRTDPAFDLRDVLHFEPQTSVPVAGPKSGLKLPTWMVERLKAETDQSEPRA